MGCPTAFGLGMTTCHLSHPRSVIPASGSVAFYPRSGLAEDADRQVC